MQIITSESGRVAGIGFIAFVIVACDRTPPKNDTSSSEASSATTESISSNELKSENLFGPPGSTIDGREWTLARLSDSFDADLTVAKAKSIFGDAPIEEREGENTLLTYMVETNDVYVPGVRVTSVDLIFIGEHLEHVRFGFTTYGDR